VTASGPPSIVVRATTTGGRFDVRVTPRAGRTALAGIREGRLAIRVSAPPVEGAANDALVRLVASVIGVPPRDLRVVAGTRGRLKTVEVVNLDATEIQRRLTEALP
jgi:uncharacterized protein (TIGR00251 family)